MKKLALFVLLACFCSMGFAIEIILPDENELPPSPPEVNLCTSLPVLKHFNVTSHNCSADQIWISLEAKDQSYVLDFALSNGVVQTWCRSNDRAVCYALGSKEDCGEARGWNWCYFGEQDVLKYPPHVDEL